MALFISSNIHQGDEIFSVQSSGKQCALKAMSLSPLSFGFMHYSIETPVPRPPGKGGEFNILTMLNIGNSPVTRGI